MREVTERLLDAVAGVVKLRHPSVGDILRKRGFVYEAAQMDELVAAFDEMTKDESTGSRHDDASNPE